MAPGSSFMFLLSVNDTITPRNFDNQPLPAYNDDTQSCASVNNCTMSNGQPALSWTTHYSSYGTCGTPLSSFMNRQQEFGVCMNFFNQTYVKTGCFDSKGTYITHYNDAACADVIASYATRNTCYFSYYDIHCNAAPTPIPGLEPTPSESSEPSTASSFRLSSILGLITLMALSVAF
jgi:hypothetical protein